jgi:hypothetical protein
MRHGVHVLVVDGVLVSCTNPCEVVKLVNRFGGIQHMTFAPTSIIGAALTDAFNGQLEIYRSPDVQAEAHNAAEAMRLGPAVQ